MTQQIVVDCATNAERDVAAAWINYWRSLNPAATGTVTFASRRVTFTLTPQPWTPPTVPTG